MLPPVEASSRRSIQSSTRSRKRQPHFAVPSGREALLASASVPVLAKLPYSNEAVLQRGERREGGGQHQVVGESPLGIEQGEIIHLATGNNQRKGPLAHFVAGHDVASRFYALPENTVNMEQLRSKHGIRTFY